jgi:hypothetical protein
MGEISIRMHLLLHLLIGNISRRLGIGFAADFANQLPIYSGFKIATPKVREIDVVIML